MSFDYKNLLVDIMSQVSNKIPKNFDEVERKYLLDKTNDICLRCAKSLSENYNYPDYYNNLICQVLSEIVIREGVFLIETDNCKYDKIDKYLERIAYTIFEFATKNSDLNISKEDFIEQIETSVGEITDEITKNVFSVFAKKIPKFLFAIYKILLFLIIPVLILRLILLVIKADFRVGVVFGIILFILILFICEILIYKHFFQKKEPLPSDSNDNFKHFLSDMMVQANELIPDNLDSDYRDFILSKIEHFANVSYERFGRIDGIDDEKRRFACQLLGEWIFRKTMDLISVGLPKRYWDPIIKQIVTDSVKIIEQGFREDISSDEMLSRVDDEVSNAYKKGLQDFVNPDKMFNRLNDDKVKVLIGSSLERFCDPDSDGKVLLKIALLRNELTDKLGFIIPNVRVISDNQIQNNEIKIFIDEKLVASVILDENDENIEDVIVSQIKDSFIKNADKILDLRTVGIYIERVKTNYSDMVAELTLKKISIFNLKQILSGLIQREISIKNIGHVFECILEICEETTDINSIVQKMTDKLK